MTNTKPPLGRISTTALAVITALLVACGPGLYDLPDPPQREGWSRHSLRPGEDEQRSEVNFMAVQDSVLSFVEDLRDENWEDAYRRLSNETRILLDNLAPDGRGESVLSDGVLERDGNQFSVDPMDLFIVRNVVDILDEWHEEAESETYRRKEVWVMGADGTVHRVVLIYEGDEWRIHHPDIDLTPGARGRRSDDTLES